MTILTKSNGAEFENAKSAASARYIFCDREILLVGGNLPDKKFYDAFVASQKEASNLDCQIIESPQNYLAAKIARKPEIFEVENGAHFTTLREFCYDNPTLAPAGTFIPA